jgi:hypothetical protein
MRNLLLALCAGIAANFFTLCVVLLPLLAYRRKRR